MDHTFGHAGRATGARGDGVVAGAAVVEPDGALVTAGEEQSGVKQLIVSTRMHRDGTLDPTYGSGGWVTVDIGGAAAGNALLRQADGRIVIAGTGSVRGALTFAAVRLRRDGSLDSAFGKAGIALVSIGSQAIANAVAIQRDGRIVLGGTAHTDRNHVAVVRLNINGTIDRRFGRNGVSVLAPPSAGWGMVLAPDGKLVLGGQTDFGDAQAYMAARVLANGALDPSFGRAGGVVTIPIGRTAIANAVALQSDGRLILAGNAFTDRGMSATVRLQPDGSPDTSFGASGVATRPLAEAVNAVTLQPNRKILIAATGATAIRLNLDGSIDRSFGRAGVVRTHLGAGDAANGVTVQPSDGKIVLSGVATVARRLVLSVIRLDG